jgi:enoyl-CoA hydratase/carnithine racemase
MTTLRLERDGILAVLRLDKARGNAIDPPLVEDLLTAAADLAKDESVRGVLLASAHPKLFCPGLDLVGLLELDRPAMGRFMLRFAEMMWALYGLRKPVVAAVNGAAVAGGCILALTADERLLRRGAAIGLNEVRVGVPLPWSVAVLLRVSVPPGSLTRVGLLGNNFQDEEAVAVGLADAVLEAEGFETACRQRLAELAEKDGHALGVTKAYLRAAALQEMKAGEAATLDAFLDGWFSAPTRERMQRTAAALTKRA